MTLATFSVIPRGFTCFNSQYKHKNLVDPKQTVRTKRVEGKQLFFVCTRLAKLLGLKQTEHQRRPSHIQPHRDADQHRRRENERLSHRAPFFAGRVYLAPKRSPSSSPKLTRHPPSSRARRRQDRRHDNDRRRSRAAVSPPQSSPAAHVRPRCRDTSSATFAGRQSVRSPPL